jgi:hypothetical protein
MVETRKRKPKTDKMAPTGSNHLKFSKTLRISTLFSYFQPFSAVSTGSTGSVNYAPDHKSGRKRPVLWLFRFNHKSGRKQPLLWLKPKNGKNGQKWPFSATFHSCLCMLIDFVVFDIWRDVCLTLVCSGTYL